MKNYALLGASLLHSISGMIHAGLFKISDEPYDRYDIADLSIDDFHGRIENVLETYAGINVTAPYKADVIKYMDELDEKAALYNSVNCIGTSNNKRKGYNTDCDGFLDAVADFPLGGKVLLAGFGGTGSMIAAEALMRGAELTICVRKNSLAERNGDLTALMAKITAFAPNIAVKEPRLESFETVFDEGDEYDLFINATTVGRYPEHKENFFPESIISSSEHIYDVNYNPLENPLIKTAKTLGKPVRNGLSMLVRQAARSHEIWYGADFKDRAIESLILQCEKYLTMINKSGVPF